MAIYPVLQSGFVAFNTKDFELPKPIEQSIRQAVIYREFKTSLLNFYYSDDVTDLYDAWSAKPEMIRDMDFREKILVTAFKCFQHKNFDHWLDLQIKSGKLSALHSKFIIETLEYVIASVPRRIENVQWISLLEADEATKNVVLNKDEFLKVHSKILANVSIPYKFTDMIQKWTQKTYGFQDLLVSMYVIFGLRSRQTTASGAG